MIPASAEKLLGMSERERATDGEGNDAWKADQRSCQGCGSQNKVDNLSRCRGCESVWYCNKVSEIMI